MSKYIVSITSGIISILFILLTGWISFSNTVSVLFDFAFIFHLIPFGIGFTGGASILIYAYYFGLWIGLALLFSPIVRSFYSSRNKIKFLTISITPIILVSVIILYIDYTKNKKREERIAVNQKKDKADFNHLKTGDLVFQKLDSNSMMKDFKYPDSTYNNIGIVFINGQNHVLLELKDQVQYVSLGRWIENGINQQYIAKRLRNADSLLTNYRIEQLRSEARNNIFKKYDSSLDWSDDKVYNAELIWKIYKSSLNVELGGLDTVKFDTTRHYIITPNAIFNSKNLMTVRKK